VIRAIQGRRAAGAYFDRFPGLQGKSWNSLDRQGTRAGEEDVHRMVESAKPGPLLAGPGE